MAAKEAIDAATAATAVSAPWWWGSFANEVNVWVPPIVAVLGMLVLLLTVVEKCRSITRHHCPIADEGDPPCE